MSNIETVQEIYAAFGSGDVPAILEHLAADVGWESWEHGNEAQRQGVSYMAPRGSHDEVVEFFGIIGSGEMHSFELLGLMDGGDRVAAEIAIDFTPPGGSRIRDEEIHLWTFGADGKVVRFRHYIDTAKHIAARA